MKVKIILATKQSSTVATTINTAPALVFGSTHQTNAIPKINPKAPTNPNAFTTGSADIKGNMIQPMRELASSLD